MVLSGLLGIHKPAGISSRDAVNHVQRLLKDRSAKIGHAGTLDPMATGVLLVALGEATRIVEHLHELDKAYIADFEFGKTSDTLDSDGEVQTVDTAVRPQADELRTSCDKWIGSVMQRPPRVSAIKIGGQRAYDLARRGTDFEPEARRVEIHRIEVLSYQYPTWKVSIDCGSGTYIRSLGRDIAEALGTCAIMTALVRTRIGPFSLEQCVCLDQLKDRQDVMDHLLSPVAGLVGWPCIKMTGDQVIALRHGQSIELASSSHGQSSRCPSVAIDDTGQWVALVEYVDTDHIRPTRVFQRKMATTQPNAIMTRHNPES